MHEYELAVLLHPDLEIDQEKALAKIEKLIANAEGTVSAREDWGKRKLAYPIKKQQFGIYCFYQLELMPTAVAELERTLKISDEVLRHLLIKRPPLIIEEEPADEEKPESTDAKKPAAKARAAAKPDKIEEVKETATKGESLPAETSARESVGKS